MAVVFSCALVLADSLVTAPSATAQQWQLTRPAPKSPRPDRARSRSPRARKARTSRSAQHRHQTLIERYLRILYQSPTDEFAVRRLVELFSAEHGGLDSLKSKLQNQLQEPARAYAAAMILGTIERISAKVEVAAGHFRRAAQLKSKSAAPHVALAELHQAQGNARQAYESYRAALERARSHTERDSIRAAMAEIAVKLALYDEARAHYRALSRSGAGNVYLQGQFADALMAQDRYERAAREYRRVAAKLRGDPRAAAPILHRLGQALAKAGRPEEALAPLQRALATGDAGTRRAVRGDLLDAYRQAGKLEQLAAELGRSNRRDVDDVLLLARVHDELGNHRHAVDAYRAALRARPNDFQARQRLILLLTRAGKLDEVIAQYRLLVQAAPEHPHFVVELAQLLMQAGRAEEALRSARAVSRRNPRVAPLHKALAELYVRWGRSEDAARELRRLVRLAPNEPTYRIALGQHQLDGGQRAQALQTWRGLLRMPMPPGEAHAILAGVYEDHDMLSEAKEQYAAALRTNAGNESYRRGYASVLDRLGSSDEALSQWNRLLESSDPAARREARRHIVAIWARQGVLQRQARQLERRFETDPPDVEAGRFLSEVYRKQGLDHAADAERVLQRLSALRPGDVEPLRALERVRLSRGDIAGALAVLERLVDADPIHAGEYLQRMAEHSLTLYRDEQAVEFAAQAVQRAPDDPAAHRRLGDLYRARQEFRQAARNYQRAVELDGKDFATYFKLAEIYVAQGQADEAAEIYERVLRASSDDQQVARAARALMQLHVGEGSLEAFERTLLPLAVAHTRRPIYRRQLIELYQLMAAPWIEAVQSQPRGAGEGPEQARTALEQLGQRAIKPLLEALVDDDTAQRDIAVGILGHLQNPQAAVPLLAVLESEGSSPELRMLALEAAAKLAPPHLAGRFEVLMGEAQDRRLRALAAWGLARMQSPSARAHLQRALRERSSGVRVQAVLGLACAEQQQVAPRLLGMLREEEQPALVATLAWAVGLLRDEQALSTLTRLLGDERSLVRAGAARGLGLLGTAEARSVLVQHALHPDDGVRDQARIGLRYAAEGKRLGCELLRSPLHSARPRRYVVEFFSGMDSAQPQLGSDPQLQSRVVEQARGALGGTEEQVRAALKALGPAAEEVRDASGPNGQSPFRDPSTIQQLVPELAALGDHPDPEVRRRVVTLLAPVGQPAAQRVVAKALFDSDSHVQMRALRALHRSGIARPKRVWARVARLARSHPQWVARLAAVRALAAHATPDAVAVLKQRLRRDDYAFVREAAAEGLGELQAVSARGLLVRKAQEDPELRVRQAARKALGHLRTSSPD